MFDFENLSIWSIEVVSSGFIRGIHIRIDIRINISISITYGLQILEAGTSEGSHQVGAGDLSRAAQMTLKRCYNFLSVRAMIIRFEQTGYTAYAHKVT